MDYIDKISTNGKKCALSNGWKNNNEQIIFFVLSNTCTVYKCIRYNIS